MKNILILAKMHRFQKQVSTNRFHFLNFLNSKPNIKVIDDLPNLDINQIIQQLITQNWIVSIIVNYCVSCRQYFGEIEIKNISRTKIPKILYMEDYQSINGIKKLVRKYRFSKVLIGARHPRIQNEMRLSLPNHVRISEYEHYIDTNVFKDYDLKKKYDILMYGNISGKYYPLRKRLFKLLQIIRPYCRIKIISNPEDYKLNGTEKTYIGKDLAMLINQSYFTIGCAGRSTFGKQYEELPNVVGSIANKQRIKIAMKMPQNKAHIYDMFVKKYFEIPLCNSIIIGDIPNGYKRLFNPSNIVLITNNMTDKQILLTIRQAFKEKTRLLEATNNLANKIRKIYNYESGYHTLCAKI